MCGLFDMCINFCWAEFKLNENVLWYDNLLYDFGTSLNLRIKA